jgi:hypothetical protein
MSLDLEQAIRERAYQLWIESGGLHGNAEAHWLAAQREILSTSFGSLGRVTATAKKKQSPRSTSAKLRLCSCRSHHRLCRCSRVAGLSRLTSRDHTQGHEIARLFERAEAQPIS